MSIAAPALTSQRTFKEEHLDEHLIEISECPPDLAQRHRPRTSVVRDMCRLAPGFSRTPAYVLQQVENLELEPDDLALLHELCDWSARRCLVNCLFAYEHGLISREAIHTALRQQDRDFFYAARESLEASVRYVPSPRLQAAWEQLHGSPWPRKAR